MGLKSNVPKKSSTPDSSIRRQAHQPQVHCAFRQVSISWGSTSLTNTYIFDRRFILQHLFQLLLESSSSAHGLLGFLKTEQWQSGHERDSWWLFALETGRVKCWLRMPPLGQIQGSREGVWDKNHWRWFPVVGSMDILPQKTFKIEVPRNGSSGILRPSQNLMSLSFLMVWPTWNPLKPPRSAPAPYFIWSNVLFCYQGSPSKTIDRLREWHINLNNNTNTSLGLTFMLKIPQCLETKLRMY